MQNRKDPTGGARGVDGGGHGVVGLVRSPWGFGRGGGVLGSMPCHGSLVNEDGVIQQSELVGGFLAAQRRVGWCWVGGGGDLGGQRASWSRAADMQGNG